MKLALIQCLAMKAKTNTFEHEEDHDRGIRWLYKTNIYLISLPDTMLTCCSPKSLAVRLNNRDADVFRRTILLLLDTF